MLSFIMLSVGLLSVVILNVIAPIVSEVILNALMQIVILLNFTSEKSNKTMVLNLYLTS